MALGPENFQIEVAEFYADDLRIYPGGSAIEIDPAVTHTVGARYKVRNVGAGITQWWSCCMTVYDVTHGIAIGWAVDYGVGGVSDWKERHINVGYITEPTAFRVRIWGNQDYGIDTPPPESKW
jgi:hypothetical protein